MKSNWLCHSDFIKAFITIIDPVLHFKAIGFSNFVVSELVVGLWTLGSDYN